MPCPERAERVDGLRRYRGEDLLEALDDFAIAEAFVQQVSAVALDDFVLRRVDFVDPGQHHHRHIVVPLIEPHLFEYLEARALVRQPKIENDSVDGR